jgi:hypothetical protein
MIRRWTVNIAPEPHTERCRCRWRWRKPLLLLHKMVPTHNEVERFAALIRGESLGAWRLWPK